MSSGRVRPLVLTFDAFGTLFEPRQSIGQQYADAARTHGLTGLTNQHVEASFRKAFQSSTKDYPNYGKAAGMDPRQWWANVIHSTFSAFLTNGTTVPDELVASLFRRFSSREGYRLYDDVMPFFKQLHDWRSTASASRSDLSRVQVGIISNSDGQRVSSILDSFGICVNETGHDSAAVKSTKCYDIDWVVTSFDSGHEKPSREIFDAAKALSASISGGDSEYLHVGDSIKEDYYGALEAGWQSVILDRDGKHEGEVPEATRVASLTLLMQKLMDNKNS
ncbi:MAG: hypothetical protein L6R38_000076 [Xanthoria sp. 2 TBL-2021]|nr:MAG: hypothetical protein L6R38_000076 [Xanthoria sp. 2 TBL-2021]